MTNQLQVCNWLVAHPEILNLANQMLNAAKSQDFATPTPMSDNYTNSVSIVWKNL